ncbi:MAG: hypothetical protein AAGA66_18900, partial [Bacteroidota bacterium]
MKARPENINTLATDRLNDCYPDAVAAVLTGSQLDQSSVTSESDMDVLVIVPFSNGMHSKVMKMDDMKMDFTVIGLIDIVKVLHSSAYNNSGVILRMLIYSETLKDSLQLVDALREKAKALYGTGHASKMYELKYLRSNLLKVRKNLLKDLGRPYSTFLLYEFVHYVSSIYLLKKEGWYTKNSYWRTKLLLEQEGHEPFIESLHELLLRGSSGDFPLDHLLALTEHYVNSPTTPETNEPAEDRLIVNLDIRSNEDKCYQDFYNQLLENTYLNKYFLLATTHEYERIFDFNYLLYFHSGLPGFCTVKVMDELASLPCLQALQLRTLKLVSPTYLYRQFHKPSHYKRVEPLLIGIHQSMMKCREEREVDHELKTVLSHVLALCLAKSFGFDEQLMKDIWKLLMIKWRDENEAQNDAVLTANQGLFITIYDTVMNDVESLTLSGWDFRQLIEQMNLFYHGISDASDRLDSYCYESLNYYVNTDDDSLRDIY